MIVHHLPLHRRVHRVASAAVAGGALTLGYATAAIASSGPAATGDAPEAPEPLPTVPVTEITATTEASWGFAGVPQLEITPLWEQPEQIALARDLAAEPELTATAGVHLRARPSTDAASLALLPEGTGLGTDDPAETEGDFTLVYTEDGLTGYVATAYLAEYAAQAFETSAVLADPGDGDYASIVEAAASRIGSTYRLAASGPDAFDCSGLVSWSYAQFGITLPRSSSAMRAVGTVIPASEARPGDIAWSPGHVSIYLGGDQQIEAVGPGQGVQQTRMWQSSVTFLRF